MSISATKHKGSVSAPASIGPLNWHEALGPELETVASGCTRCGACVRDCLFLQRLGEPGELAGRFLRAVLDPESLYGCSLCGLCSAVCPEKLDPGRLFWLMRCSFMERNRVDLRPYRRVLNYERAGLSRAFELFQLPAGCTTVFFPGCALPGTRPAQCGAVIDQLRRRFDHLGIVLSCCAKPSHDLGRLDFFRRVFARLHVRLLEAGVTTVLTACPSCQQVFSRYGTGLEVRSIYQVLEAAGLPPDPDASDRAVTIHDPCNARDDVETQRAARKLLEQVGVNLEEMKHSGARALCCGEGGSAFCVNPAVAGNWVEKRRQEAGTRRLITYCSGCTAFLGRHLAVGHLVDFFYDSSAALDGSAPVTRWPLSYLSRLLLKFKLRWRYKA